MSLEPIILDTGNAAAVLAYEQAFYRAYKRLGPIHPRMGELWDWDDEAGRLRTRIPYGEQWVFAVYDSMGEIVLAGGVNTAMRTLQSAAFGFSIPPDAVAPCELLTVFSGERKDYVRHFRPCWNKTLSRLAAEGFRSAWATAAPRLLPLHRWLGGVEVEQRVIGGLQRHWLLYELVA